MNQNNKTKLNPKLILFDFDGTIADSFDINMETSYKLLKNINQELSLEKVKYTIRNTPIKSILKKFKINKFKLFLFLFLVKRKLKKVIFKVKPFNNVEETLIELKNKNYQLAILSSNSKKNVELFLDKYKLKSYFEFVISKSSLFGKNKVFDDLLLKNNFNKKDLIYIGDEIRDLESSRKSNIECIILTCGFNSFELIEKENPKYISNSFSEILSYLK